MGLRWEGAAVFEWSFRIGTGHLRKKMHVVTGGAVGLESGSSTQNPELGPLKSTVVCVSSYHWTLECPLAVMTGSRDKDHIMLL